MMAETETDRIIAILEDAKLRSETNESPCQFSSQRDLSLIFDLIQAKHVRGDVVDDKYGVPRGAAMVGITLSGREYLSRLTSEREALAIPAKLKRAGWIFVGWLAGLATGGASAAIAVFVGRLMKSE